MGIIIRQSITSTIFTYLGVVVGYVNILILFPKYMSPEEVGLTRTIQDAAMLLVPFVQLGVSQLTIKYFPKYYGKTFYGEFVSLIFGLFLIAAIIFTIFFLLFKNEIAGYFSTNSELVNNYLFYILGLALLLSLHQVLVAYAQSLHNIVLPNFLKEVTLRAFTLIDILLFALKVINFHTFINVLVVAYAFNLVILAIYLTSRNALQYSFNWRFIQWGVVKEMITYSLFTFLGAGGILIIGKVDSIMVAGMINLDANAVYTTAFYIAVLIELPKRAVAQIGMPIVSKAFKDNNIEEVQSIYAKSSINNLIIGSLLFIGIWINLDNIFLLIPNNEVYALGKYVVLIVGAGKLIDMAAGINGEIIVMSKHYRVNVYLIVLMTIFTITANYYLIPLYGLEGAAIGSAVALLLFNFGKYLFLLLKEKIQPFSVQTLKVVLIAAITAFVGLELPYMGNVIIDILVRSTIATTVFAGLIIWLKPSEDVEMLLKQALVRFKNS
ncbi:MAG: oligosaccharide flippase family protein [Cyclobacteriaceae bacterium]|nr:oligosaccharide flippase family protein [Cyclobacteriaceae bacterium]